MTTPPAPPIAFEPADAPRVHGVSQKSYFQRHWNADVKVPGGKYATTRRKLRVTLDVDTGYASQSRLTVDLFDGDKWNTIVTAHPQHINLDVKKCYRFDLRGHEPQARDFEREEQIRYVFDEAEGRMLGLAKVVLT